MPKKKKTEPDVNPDASAAPRPSVVGIGASAGGLSALRAFLRELPERTGLAWVVVVHLNPEHESHLAELLQPHVRMPVQQVVKTMPLEPDHVYVIPPGANLSAVDTHLRLSDMQRQRSVRAPVDHFFRTLAATHDGHAVGVILTGTGSDGALGIKAIKERGGFTLVQDPADAEFDGMPRSAISTGLVDQVLPLPQLPHAVLRLAYTDVQVPLPAEGQELDAEQRQNLQKIFAQLRARTSRDFTGYKRSTLLRRIQRRMQLRTRTDLASYLELLRNDTDEVRALADDILITVTNFFRDATTWEHLARDVVPDLFGDKGAQETVRVWCVGCATGEEAYSIAILLLEEAARRETPAGIQIFASDLHEPSLERAREGFYPGDIEADVSEERLRRFFHKEDGGYRVRKEVRERVVFAPHNLLTDPPFSRLDLITCRNLLIYLQRDVQRTIIELFHYALRPEGALLLGTSETVEGSELFRTESKSHCIFRKRNVARSEPRLPPFPTAPVRLRGEPRAAAEPHAQAGFGALHRRLVEQNARPSMLVSPDGRVVHLSEGAGRFLVIPGGEPTMSAFRLVREELRIELRTALHAAQQKGSPARSRPVEVRFDGSAAWVSLDVRPARGVEQEGFSLVFFDERDAAELALPRQGETAGEQDGQLRQLRAELDLTKQRLQAIIEEYETSQEEMKASHEELQSSNEELRSTLEELETSKEELQSVNEELQTVNQENRHKVEELAQLTSDLQNLLGSTEIATLFLDRELRILRFTPQIGELFNVRAVDRGRPLSDLTHRLGYPDMRADAESVLRRLTPVEREVRDESGSWYLTRLLPYRSTDDRIEGVVITFVDITARKAAEEALQQLNETLEQRVEERARQVREQEERFRTLVETAALTVWSADAQGGLMDDSPSWRSFTGQTPDERVGVGWLAAVHPDDRSYAADAWRRCVQSGTPLNAEFRLRHDPSDTWRWTNARAAPLRDESGAITGWVGMNIDIHGKREAEDARREVMQQLVSAEEDERRRIARELHDQLSQQITGLVLDLRNLQQQTDSPELRQQLHLLEQRTAAVSRDVQTLALRLRPPALDNLGLQLALESLLEEWAARHGLSYDLHASGIEDSRLSREAETTIYRAVQEALTNVLKHAAASRVSVVVERRADAVQAIIEDDGAGFDVESTLSAAEKAKRLGIRGMRERVALLGGSIDIESSPGAGTTIFVRLPQRTIGPAAPLGAS